MNHHDSQKRIAFTALIVTLVSLDTYIAFALARQQPIPWAMVAPYGALMAVGLLALPLVWWRHRAGSMCATALGVLNLLAELLATSGGLQLPAPMAQPTSPLIASTVAVSALVIVYGVRAWREPVPLQDRAVEPQTPSQ